jgi:cellulose biosynthesis protein BcsQ/tetratricopeptide (TPR) repeat protein
MTTPPAQTLSGQSSSETSLAPASFVTFYSFKGGVGRSMALINTACILAGTRGFRVLVLDLDLEAPGLSYLNTEPSDAPLSSERPATPAHLGFVDLITDAKVQGEKADLFCMEPADLAEKYTRRVRIPDSNSEFKDGELRIMPAGLLDGGYTRRLDALGLNGLYRAGIGEPLMRAFKQLLAASGRYDYVLIDSRTGISEGAGICTRDLADHVVVLSGLNRQNVEGTSRFLAEFRAMTQGSKSVQLVLSPIPNGEDDLLERRRDEAARKFGAALGKGVDLSLEIPYHPQLALTEEPHIFRSKRGYLLEAYRRIEQTMLQFLGHTAPAYRQDVITSLDAKAYSDGFEKLKRLVRLPSGQREIEPILNWVLSSPKREVSKSDKEVTRDSSAFDKLVLQENGEAFFSTIVQNLRGNYDPGLFVQFYNKLLKAFPNSAEQLIKATLSSKKKGEFPLTQIARLLWREEKPELAREFLSKAIELGFTDTRTFRFYARVLQELGLFSDAEAAYKSILQTTPKNPEALFDYALLLSSQSRLAEARIVYEQGIEIDKNNPIFLGNLAQILFATGDSTAAQALLVRLDKFNEAPDELKLEVLFYQLAHLGQTWPSLLTSLRTLIDQGVRSTGWSFDITIERAAKDDHPYIHLLRSLAAVICDGADPKTLDVYPEWQAAKP